MRTLSVNDPYIPGCSQREPRGFQKPSLTEELKAAYQAKFCEAGRLETHTGLRDSQGARVVKYRDLPETKVNGCPYAIDRDERGELQCHFPVGMPNAHELIIGATGSGKTTSLVEPRLRVLSTKKNRASLFLTDPKGELLRRHGDHLRRQGYRVQLLNFKDVSHSDTWNPLLEVYDAWMRHAQVTNSFARMSGWDRLVDYELASDPESYSEVFWVCDGRAFSTRDAAVRWRDDQVAYALANTADLIRQLSYAFIPDSMVASHDPSWMLGARDILSGMIYLILEDALDHRSGMGREQMNLMTLQAYSDLVRGEALGSGGVTPLLQTNKLSHKSLRNTSIQMLRNYLENAPSTSRSYAGIYRNAMQEWFHAKVFTITNSSTIDLGDGDEPVAIFLITRDSERSDFVIASLFIDWVYRKLLERADSSGGRLSNEFIFLLDEFPNIPPIRDFTSKITAARSRNIAFQMVLQSYAQLSDVYGTNAAQVIIDNCDCTFLGSKNHETKARFAKECGRQTVPSLEAVLDPTVHRMVEVPVITVDRLERLEPGQMYMRRMGMPLLLTQCEPCYRCPELTPERTTSPKELGIEAPPYNDPRYRYEYLENDMKMGEFYRSRLVAQQLAGELVP